MATAGSFCLFCENGVDGLPTVTSWSAGEAEAATAAPARAAVAAATEAMMRRGVPMIPSRGRPSVRDRFPARLDVSTLHPGAPTHNSTDALMNGCNDVLPEITRQG